MINVIDAASGGVIEYVGVEAFKNFISKTNKGLAKENSINPRPKFHYEEKFVGDGLEVYLCVEDLSNNWLELTVKVESKSNSFASAINGYTRLPVIEPNSKGALFFLGSFNTTNLAVSTGNIYIEALVATNDKDEKARGLLVFSGSDKEFLDVVRESETDLKNIVLKIDPITEKGEYSSKKYYEYLISERIAETPFEDKERYRSQLAAWWVKNENICSDENADEKVRIALSKDPEWRTKIILTNRSKTKTYKNLELTVTFSQDVLFVDESYDVELPMLPKFEKPKEVSWGLPSYTPLLDQGMIDLQRRALMDYSTFSLINSDVSIYKSDLNDRALIIEVRELRANSSIIITEDSGYAILAKDYLNQKNLRCTVDLREESFGYLSKEIVVNVS